MVGVMNGSIPRAFKIVVPKESYQNACLTLRIPTLKEKRESLCKSLFNAMKDSSHRLHHMIPVHIINKIKTHSIQRITNDIKELFITNYTEKCVIEKCYICNKT